MTVRLPGPVRRRQLLEVAIEAFATQGFHVTSMNDVAQAAGVTKPVLYQHFGSKRGLYLELLRDVGAELEASIRKATSEARGPRAQVEAGFRAYFDFVVHDPHAFRLLFGGGSRRDDEFATAVAATESAIADAIAELITIDDADPAHRRLLAHGLVGMAEATGRAIGRNQRGEDDGLAPDAELLARRVANLAWGGLRSIEPI